MSIKMFALTCKIGAMVMCCLAMPLRASMCIDGDDSFATVPTGSCATQYEREASMRVWGPAVEFVEYDPYRLSNRAFMRVLIGNPRVEIEEIDGSIALDESAASVIQVPFDRLEDNLFSVLTAFGYMFENWSIEGEALVSRRIKRNINPLGVGLPASALVELKNYSLFFNARYYIPHCFSFYPKRLQLYLSAGFGPSLKFTDVTTFFTTFAGGTSQSDSKSLVRLAGNIGCGLRYQLAANWLVDLDWRVFHLGAASFEPVRGLALTADDVNLKGLFLGGTYQF